MKGYIKDKRINKGYIKDNWINESMIGRMNEWMNENIFVFISICLLV